MGFILTSFWTSFWVFGILKRDLSELIRKNRSKWLSGVQLSGCCTVLNLLVMKICALWGGGADFPWKFCVSLRVVFFSCCVALERILTTDNLRRRVLIVVEWCFVCILFVWVFLGWWRCWGGMASGSFVSLEKMKCSVLRVKNLAWWSWNTCF